MTSPGRPEEPQDAEAQVHERWRALRDLESWLETPMALLGLVWLVLLILELTIGLTPALQVTSLALWAVFVLDFGLRLALAPGRVAYVRKNWLTALTLLVPALRVGRLFRIVRVLRLSRGIRLVRLVSSVNRGMNSLAAGLGRRGAAYAFALTVIVVLAGAAGMLAFEGAAGNSGMGTYRDALWWTAMIITTMGSEYWPRTPEGRILAVLLSFYALAVLGYITAALASYFMGRDTVAGEGRLKDPQLAELQHAIAALTERLDRADAAR